MRVWVYSVIFIAGESLVRTLLSIIPPSRMSHAAFLLYGVSFLKSRTRYVTLAPSPPFSVNSYHRKYTMRSLCARHICIKISIFFFTLTISILFIYEKRIKVSIYLSNIYVLKNCHELKDFEKKSIILLLWLQIEIISLFIFNIINFLEKSTYTTFKINGI